MSYLCHFQQTRRFVLVACGLAAICFGTSTQAQQIQQVVVPSTATFNTTTGYTYSYSVMNITLMDLAIITVPVGQGSSLMNLTAPVGFGINFDPGVSLVSFFEDNDPSTPATFSPASTISGFSFTSFYSPGTVTFDALDINGNDYTGPTMAPIVASAVPEPTSVVFLLVGLILAGGAYFRRRTAFIPTTSAQ